MYYLIVKSYQNKVFVEPHKINYNATDSMWNYKGESGHWKETDSHGEYLELCPATGEQVYSYIL
jgi:hypothetical protein